MFFLHIFSMVFLWFSCIKSFFSPTAMAIFGGFSPFFEMKHPSFARRKVTRRRLRTRDPWDPSTRRNTWTWTVTPAGLPMIDLVMANSFFPTCQVRVVRFYQSACPPAASSSSSSSTSSPPCPPPRLCLFHLHFRLANLANSSPSSSPTSQLSAHCWTSTCELPSSVCTAGPQPASCPAQCAPLDLNRGPAQPSVHRWTSTGDLPSSVCTAGPQPQCALLDLNLGPAQLSVHTAGPDRMPEDMPDGM